MGATNDKTTITFQMAKFVIVLLALFLASVAAISVHEELEENSFLHVKDDDSSSAVDEKPTKPHFKIHEQKLEKEEKKGKMQVPDHLKGMKDVPFKFSLNFLNYWNGFFPVTPEAANPWKWGFPFSTPVS